MEQRVQLKTWKCGLDRLHGEMGEEFWWIGGKPGEQQFVVVQFIDHGLSLMCHGWLGQRKGFFSMNEIKLIEMASCDGQQVGKLKSSSDRGVAYP